MTSADLPGWLLTYAAHSTLLLGLAWWASRTVQSHAIKDLLWKTALIGGLVTTTLQRANVASLGRYGFRVAMPETVATAPTPAPVQRAHLKPTIFAPKAKAAGDVAVLPSQPEASAETDQQSLPSSPSLPSPTVFLVGWAVVAAALLLRFIAARWRLSSGFGRRTPVAEGSLTMMLAELRVAAGIRRPIKLTHSAGLASPVAFGLGEICLPDVVLTDLDIEQQHSVLAHELAHLARFDPLWLDLAGVLERVFFFQPLNVMARKRIQDGAEYLCDDWAVRRTGSGLTLAKCLVKVAEWMEGTPHAVPVSGMAEHRSQLVARIHRLIGNHAMRTGPRPRWLVPASAVLLIATAAFAPGFSSGTTITTTNAGTPPTGEAAISPALDFNGVASDTDTVAALTSKARQEREIVAALADVDRKAATMDRLKTSELRAELAAKGHSMTSIAMDMKAAKLASTLDGIRWNMRGNHAGDTNSVAVPALLEALKDPAVEVRRAAAQSLANLEDPRTVPGLIDALKDSDKEVRQSCAQGLGQLGDERAIDGLIGVMKDSDPDVRQAAVEALGELRSQKAIPGFTYALKDENKDVRRAAIQALGSLENPKPIDALIAALKDNDGDVRQAAVNALDGTDDKRAVAPLIALLSDPVADVRQASCSALGSLRDPSAAQPISALLKDSNADVRESCASALGNMELKSAPAGLLDALRDPKADVRQRAAETIGSIQDAKGVPGLKLLLDDANGDVREAAIDALSNIPDRAALDALIGALKSKDANVRKRAAEALGHREE